MLSTWILALILKLAAGVHQPAACGLDCPRIADDIAEASLLDPLYRSSEGEYRTASTLVAVAWYESNFIEQAGGPGRPAAEGDHHHSLGLWQMQPETIEEVFDVDMPHGELRSALLTSKVAAPWAIKMIRKSFAICKQRPLDERLSWYTAGGEGCKPEGAKTSRHRMQLAKRLFEENPPPGESDHS